ncbi:MAG: hypothetical protein K0R18_1389 [Bacillales bacterium]|jgi:uncharacterized membrane protein|nr:hypothetical protein [Bacillales bacterium]
MYRNFALNAMVGALYAVTTIMIAPLAYGNVQFRLTEILIFFAFFNKKFIPGLVVGCMIANSQSGMGMIDVFLGAGATLIVTYLISKTKNIWLVPIIAAVVNGIVVGWELNYVFELPMLESMIYVAIGEFFAVIVGIPVFNYLMKNNYLKKMILE